MGLFGGAAGMSWHASLSRKHLFDIIYLVSRDVADLSIHHLDLIVHGKCSALLRRVKQCYKSHAPAGTHWLSSVRAMSEDVAGLYREGMQHCGYSMRSIESALKFSMELQPRLKNVVR
jgi:hypothetical protein